MTSTTASPAKKFRHGTGRTCKQTRTSRSFWKLFEVPKVRRALSKGFWLQLHAVQVGRLPEEHFLVLCVRQRASQSGALLALSKATALIVGALRMSRGLSVVLLSGTIGDGWVSTRANLAKMPCAQNNNLIASFLAFCLSVGAVTIAVLEIGKVEEAFQSMGRGSPLRDASVRTVIQLCFSLLVNLVGFFNICALSIGSRRQRVREIQANEESFAAILWDGSVVTWGSLDGGDSGLVQERLRSVREIQAGAVAFAALRSDGTVVAWGDPAAPYAFAALLDSGSVVTWGSPIFGGSSNEVQMQLRENVKQIASAGFAFAAVLGDGSVAAWGAPDAGGDASGVQDQLENVQQVQATDGAFAALLKDGGVVTWGSAEHGGDSSSVHHRLQAVQAIQANEGAFAALCCDGSVATWGISDAGGDSATVQEQLNQVQELQSTESAFAAILLDGHVVTWGQSAGGGESSKVRTQLEHVKCIQASYSAFAALRADGTVVTWGDAACGGDSKSVQEQLRNVQHIQATQGAFAAIRLDGSVVAWGEVDCGGDTAAVKEQLEGKECLSTFHCESMMQFFFAHMATTSHAFCILRMISFTTLLVQLFLSSEILVGAGVALFLNFVCHLGSTTRFHVQEVIWEIGNFTKTGRDPFDPYRTGSMQEANSADTHFISVARLLQHLDLDHFCYFSGNLESSMTLFWLCSLASHVSQVLMTIALNGEKERVGVHEENDEAAQHGLSSEDGIALLSRGLNQGVSQSRMVMQDTASRAAAYAGGRTKTSAWGFPDARRLLLCSSLLKPSPSRVICGQMTQDSVPMELESQDSQASQAKSSLRRLKTKAPPTKEYIAHTNWSDEERKERNQLLSKHFRSLPDAPRTPRSAWLVFCSEFFAWQSLGKAERVPYDTAAQTEKDLWSVLGDEQAKLETEKFKSSDAYRALSEEIDQFVLVNRARKQVKKAVLGFKEWKVQQSKLSKLGAGVQDVKENAKEAKAIANCVNRIALKLAAAARKTSPEILARYSGLRGSEARRV
eukprot:s2021_g3.t2